MAAQGPSKPPTTSPRPDTGQQTPAQQEQTLQEKLEAETRLQIRGILGGLPVAEQRQEYFVVFDEAGDTGPELIVTGKRVSASNFSCKVCSC